MNLLRYVYPLRLRQCIYYRLIASSAKWPGLKAQQLVFANTSLVSLSRSDWGHRSIAWLGFYELELTRKIAAIAAAGGLFVDVGANAGYFSCLWASIREDNFALAFEPSPRNQEMLSENIRKVGLANRIK